VGAPPDCNFVNVLLDGIVFGKIMVPRGVGWGITNNVGDLGNKPPSLRCRGGHELGVEPAGKVAVAVVRLQSDRNRAVVCLHTGSLSGGSYDDQSYRV
jgi:hypothetical protein